MDRNTINRFDSILPGITFDELITTLQCNEKIIDPSVVLRVYKEILKIQMEDACFILKENMDYIMNECKVSNPYR